MQRPSTRRSGRTSCSGSWDAAAGAAAGDRRPARSAPRRQHSSQGPREPAKRIGVGRAPATMTGLQQTGAELLGGRLYVGLIRGAGQEPLDERRTDLHRCELVRDGRLWIAATISDSKNGPHPAEPAETKKPAKPARPAKGGPEYAVPETQDDLPDATDRSLVSGI